MPHWLIHGAAIASRVLAGLLGCVCVYVACFLYDSEEGIWQNRLDDLWIGINDRAQITESRTTALFNKTGSMLQSTCDRVFGASFISFRAIGGSLNISVGITIAILAVEMSQMQVEGVEVITTAEAFLALIFVLVLAASVVLSASLYRRKWGSMPLCVPWLFLLLAGLIVFQHQDSHIVGMFSVIGLEPWVIIGFSTISDLIAMAAIRRLVTALSHTVALWRVLFVLFILALGASASLGLPYLLSSYDPDRMLLQYLNLPTAFYCAIPMLLVLALIAHRLLWPILGRVIYPLCRYKIVTNRKALISVGSLCVTFAFNLERVGAKELLKLAT